MGLSSIVGLTSPRSIVRETPSESSTYTLHSTQLRPTETSSGHSNTVNRQSHGSAIESTSPTVAGITDVNDEGLGMFRLGKSLY